MKKMFLLLVLDGANNLLMKVKHKVGRSIGKGKYTLKPPLLLFLAYFIISVATGQTPEVSHDNQQWIQYFNTLKLSTKSSIITDVGFRWKNDFSDKSLYLARSYFQYNVNQNFSIGAGLANFNRYSGKKIGNSEIRPFQEIALKSKMWKIAVNHRYRLEERYFNSLETGARSFNFRFRYSLGLVIPVFKFTKEDKNITLGVGNEIFLNSSQNHTINIFDQYRFLITPTFNLNKTLTFSLVYNHQYQLVRSGSGITNSDVLWLQIRHKVDLSKTKKG